MRARNAASFLLVRLRGIVTTMRAQRSDIVTLLIGCTGQFLATLVVTIMNVALPAVQDGLGFTNGELQWVTSAYALTFAGFLLLGGRLVDRYGCRTVIVTGTGVFTAASLVGGVAVVPVELVLARAVQGVGAAVLAPATLTLLTTTREDATRALGAWAAAGAAGDTAPDPRRGAVL